MYNTLIYSVTKDCVEQGRAHLDRLTDLLANVVCVDVNLRNRKNLYSRKSDLHEDLFKNLLARAKYLNKALGT